jgi:hypothetical protein
VERQESLERTQVMLVFGYSRLTTS